MGSDDHLDPTTKLIDLRNPYSNFRSDLEIINRLACKDKNIIQASDLCTKKSKLTGAEKVHVIHQN